MPRHSSGRSDILCGSLLLVLVSDVQMIQNIFCREVQPQLWHFSKEIHIWVCIDEVRSYEVIKQYYYELSSNETFRSCFVVILYLKIPVMNVNNIQKQKFWIGLILANNLMWKTRNHFIKFYELHLQEEFIFTLTYFSGHFSQMTQVKNDGWLSILVKDDQESGSTILAWGSQHCPLLFSLPVSFITSLVC